MTLYILSNFNNYTNRTVRRFDSLEEYESFVIFSEPSVNFNPADGIIASHVIGQGDYDGKGDYLLAVDNDNSIVSRWFIIETDRTRAGQYNLTLKRDVVADYLNVIKESPMYIEKATLTDINDPLVYNLEDFAVNQIKTNEYLLKDRSKCAWLVGYMAKDAGELTGTVAVNAESSQAYISINANTINDWEYANRLFVSKVFNNASYMVTVNDVYSGGSQDYDVARYTTNVISPFETSRTVLSKSVSTQLSGAVGTTERVQQAFQEVNPDYSTAYDFASDYEIGQVLYFSGQTVKTNDGKYYKVNLHTGYQVINTHLTAGALFEQIKQVYINKLGCSGNLDKAYFAAQARTYTLSFTETSGAELSYTIPTTKNITTDATYDIFAIPYGEITGIEVETGIEIEITKETAIKTICAIQATHQQKIFDIQLLPYCPVQELISENYAGEPFIGLQEREKQFSYITSSNGDSFYGFIIFASQSQFTFNITDVQISQAQTVLQKKVNNQCDKWRLTSPNYSNYFDFSVEKNGGISLFNVDCTYKPYTPYIHINPDFKGLYGYDDNSPRGLVCGGDYSLSQVGDAWQQYQIQNKYYQDTFDRQIQNMEVNNEYQRTMEKWAIGTGTVSGIASGAFAGGAMSGGNPYAAAAGAIVGGVTSLAGGIADYRLKEGLREEQLDFTKDMFNYSLQNIQALPQTLSKISAYNLNNKIFPVLEYYTCTDREKEAFRNKIKWNGMTVMVITNKMNEYITSEESYIKGQLIRLEGTEEDSHICMEIQSELIKGVYIKE